MQSYSRSRVKSSEKWSSFWKWAILFILGFLLFWFFWIKNTGNIIVPTNSFQVAKGDSVYTLKKSLKIDISDTRYKLFVRFFTKDLKIQSGIYSIGTGATLASIFDSVLTNPPTSKDISVMILPGWNVRDIEAVLVEQWLAGTGEITNPSKELFTKLSKTYTFLQEGKGSFEGFLYPDTYRLSPSFGLEASLKKMLENFDKKISSKSDISGVKFYNTLVMASIVEKEERSADNKPTVAGVLWNRVNKNDFIGADATVCYPHNVLTVDCTPSFILKHLYDKNDYNTRAKVWMPPTPISNVTAESFRAAKNPENTNYYYYLHDPSGIIHYATTATEHAVNKTRYLR